MIRRFAFLLPIVGMFVFLGIWQTAKHFKEPISQRRADILHYVKQYDDVDAIVITHVGYAYGGTTWILQTKNVKWSAFEVTDNATL